MSIYKRLTMISGETVDNVQVIPQSLLIFRTRKTRANFTFGPKSEQIVGIHEQVVRANFTSDRQTLENEKK